MRIVAGRTDHVVVVGAGLSGLAAALHLCGRGRSVTVLEREAVPGGRTGRRDVRGHRLDTGPAVLTMPGVVEETLGAVGASPDDRLTLTRLDPICRAYLPDGSALDVRAGREAMTEAVRAFAGLREAAGYARLRDRLARSCGHGRFLRERRVFPGPARYTGPSPRQAPALYAVAAMDAAGGAWFPRGGMRALPDALAGAAADAGVDLRYGTTVSALERHGRRVIAAHTTGGERIPCDAIVLTCEPTTARRLLGHAPPRPSPSAPPMTVVHLSVTGEPGDLAHHNLLFGNPTSDGPLLVTRPTATDPTLAPNGRQLLSVPVPSPTWSDGGGDQAASAYAEALIATRCGLHGTAETLAVLTPADQGLIARTPPGTACTYGRAEPSGPTLARTSDNVVLAGCGTLPGLDAPTALLSGRQAADRVTGTPTPRPRLYAGRT